MTLKQHPEERAESFDDNEETWFCEPRRESRRPSRRPSMMRPEAPAIDDSVADGWFFDV